MDVVCHLGGHGHGHVGVRYLETTQEDRGALQTVIETLPRGHCYCYFLHLTLNIPHMTIFSQKENVLDVMRCSEQVNDVHIVTH